MSLNLLAVRARAPTSSLSAAFIPVRTHLSARRRSTHKFHATLLTSSRPIANPDGCTDTGDASLETGARSLS